MATAATAATVACRYKELKTDVPGFNPPKHGHLQTWADQGVLLLNAVLTVQKASKQTKVHIA